MHHLILVFQYSFVTFAVDFAVSPSVSPDGLNALDNLNHELVA